MSVEFTEWIARSRGWVAGRAGCQLLLVLGHSAPDCQLQALRASLSTSIPYTTPVDVNPSAGTLSIGQYLPRCERTAFGAGASIQKKAASDIVL
jgi:hypothetical protein